MLKPSYIVKHPAFLSLAAEMGNRDPSRKICLFLLLALRLHALASRWREPLSSDITDASI